MMIVASGCCKIGIERCRGEFPLREFAIHKTCILLCMRTAAIECSSRG